MVTATPLSYYPYNPEKVSSTVASLRSRGGRRRRRHGHNHADIEGQVDGAGGTYGSTSVPSMEEYYDPSACEFTIFYFADSTCRNCLRFGPILAKFLHDANTKSCKNAASLARENDSMVTSSKSCGGNESSNEVVSGDDTPPILQCICVPNDTTENGAQTICNGMGLYCMPFDHNNRLAIIRYVLVESVTIIWLMKRKYILYQLLRPY